MPDLVLYDAEAGVNHTNARLFGPVVGYFVAFHGDWSYLYVIPWRRIPSAVDLVLVVLASATLPAGLAAGRAAARAGRSGLLVRCAAGPGAALIVIVALFARRLATSASYAQYHGAFGVESIASSALGRGVLLAALALSAGVAFSLRAVRS